MMAAILLPVVIGGAGLALDFSAALLAKSDAQTAADAAALAASAALAQEEIRTKAQAQAHAKEFVDAHFAGDSVRADVVIVEAVDPKTLGKRFTVQVAVKQTYKTTVLSQILGTQSIDVSAFSEASSATKTQKSISMYLVLDKSGSMLTSTTQVKSNSACWYYTDHDSRSWRAPCYFSQIEALQNAAGSLFDQFDKIDPSNRYIRVGSIAYDSGPNSQTPLDWGSSASRVSVQTLQANGNTSSTKAFEQAYKALIDPMEITRHINENGVTPSRYILFMTDGANNNQADDVATKKLCKDASKAGITVFGVAFNAPPKGKDLLRVCASGGQNYYDAQDAADLIKAFDDIGQMAAGDLPRLTQ
jgi:Flp pilus assembly protein TadG/uncharacterized protein YegL